MQNPHNHPVRLRLPPLHRRGISWCRTHTTTPSGCACHPSTGGELAGAEPTQLPRQASPATPPQEGNWWRGAVKMVQNPHNHPVRLRLPPLRRRGIVCLHRRGIGGAERSRWYRPGTTTPSGFACHPSTGGELAGTEPTQPPRQAELDTPPQEGNTTPTNYHECFLCIIKE